MSLLGKGNLRDLMMLAKKLDLEIGEDLKVI